MKVLIWIGCFILHFIISGTASGVIKCIPVADDGAALLIGSLNGLLTLASIAFCIWIAITLCKKWDRYSDLKKADEAGLTLSDYAKKDVPEEVLLRCEELKTKSKEQLEVYLEDCVKQGLITKDKIRLLMREYME